MGRVLKKLSAISLTFLVFATNMARVEDLVNDGTCHWICKTENGDIDSKELKEIISQGKLIKLALVHQARVDQTCANQTSNAIKHRSNKFAEIWLKKMSVSSSRGIIESLSLAVLETIYSVLIFNGSYREMSVTCIFKSTTMPASNHSSRLALLTPQSPFCLPFVESPVLNENDTFLTLMRVEEQTRIAVESVRSARDSPVAAKDNEMIVSNTWWFVIAMIPIGIFFYPAILLLCRPSQVTVQLLRKTREEREDKRLTKLPTQAEDNADINAMNNDGHATEHVDSNRGDNLSPASPAVTTDFAGIMETQPPREDDEGTPLSREDTKGSRDSELAMVVGRPSGYWKEKGHSYRRLPNYETESKQPGAATAYEVPVKKPGTVDERTAEYSSDNEVVTRSEHSTTEEEEEVNTANKSAVHTTYVDVHIPQFDHSSTEIEEEELRSANAADEHSINSATNNATHTSINYSSSEIDSRAGTAVGAATAYEVPVKKPGAVDERTAEYSSDNEVVTRSEHSTTEEEEEVNTANKSAVYTTYVDVNIPQFDHSSTEIEEEELRSANAADEHSINSATNNATHTSINYSSSEIDSRAGTAVGAATAYEVPVKKPGTVDERIAEYSSDNEVVTRSEHSTTEEEEEVNTANKSAVHTTYVDVNIPQFDHSSTEIEEEELRSANAADEHSINSATNNATHTSINYSSSEIDSRAGTAVGAVTAYEVPVKKPGTVDERTAEYSSDNEVVTRSEHSTTEEEEEVNTANKSTVHTTYVDVNIPQFDHSSTEIEEEELRSANAADEHSINSATNNATHTSINDSSSEIDSRNTDENCACMIMVGGPDPVSIGSWIGNNFFSVTNKTKFPRLKEVAKLFLITFCPLLLFTAVGDLLLQLLNFHSRVALYLPNHSLTGSVINVVSNLPLPLIILAIVSFICYCLRYCFLFGNISSNISKSITWTSCFVHSRLPLLLWRDEHDNSAQECPKHLEVPENMLHNLNELPDIFVKCVCLLKQRLCQYFETTKLSLPKKVICFLPVVVIFFVCFLGILVVGVLLSSPLVCLCHGRMWILNERFQNKFRGSHFILPILECVFIGFSLFWVAFYLSGCTIVMGVATISFIMTLQHHTKEMLPHLTVVILACLYFWSCYSCFKDPYCDLVKKLFTSYKKKYDEMKKNRGPNELISYKQGENLKLIPRELFKYACKHKLIDIPVKKNFCKFLLKLALPLLLFLYIFPVIQAPNTDLTVTVAVITFLTVAYKVNDYINGATSFPEGDVDEVVKEYIKKQQ